MKYAFKAAALSTVVALAGFSLPALAAPTPAFTVDTGLFGYQTGSPAANSVFQANFIAGSASTLLTLNANNINQNGKGYINFSTFVDTTLPIANLPASLTGLNFSNTNGYYLWAEFSYVLSLTSGTYASINSAYKIDSLTFNIYGERANGAANNSTFLPANNTNVGSATVTHSADTLLLATGTSTSGASNLNSELGTSLNSTLNLSLTSGVGDSFFVSPNPFYNIAFSSFTNTRQGFDRAGNLAAINNATGGVDFAENQVPEPTSVALLGLGLVALAASRRRRNVK